MLLAIDIGNSNISFGVFKDNELVAHFRIDSLRHRSSDEYGVLISCILSSKGIPMSDIKEGIISSVVPPILDEIKVAFKDMFGVYPLSIPGDIDAGIPVHCDKPDEVGTDRLVNAVAGYHKYSQALIIIDFGTATTFDCISREGIFLGGAISPGVGISADALSQKAYRLPSTQLSKPLKAIGKNTQDAMKSGIFLGYVSLVEGMIKLLSVEMGTYPLVIATGGLSSVFAGETVSIKTVEPHLTLEGLKIIHENRKSGLH